MLGGGEALENLFSHRPLTQTGDEGLDNPEVDIGFQESQANLPQGLVEDRLRDTPLSFELPKYPLQSVL